MEDSDEPSFKKVMDLLKYLHSHLAKDIKVKGKKASARLKLLLGRNFEERKKNAQHFH